MTGSKRIHRHVEGEGAHKSTHATHDAHASHAGLPPHARPLKLLRWGTLRLWRRPRIRHLVAAAAVLGALVVVAMLGLWWRLASGPIELDLATPWLKAAIEQNFGGTQTVSVGGTQIERDEKGRTSLRLRDIVVRDADGTVVASAPKAEVGISARALLSGELRAQSLNLVGAEMSVRIESDGRVTIFAGADKRPIATAVTPIAPTPAAPQRDSVEEMAGALAWIDSIGASGLDGHDLTEIGLKNGNLTVDDRRTGKHWTFDRINVSLTRPTQGGVLFKLESVNPERPWVLSAAMRPLSDGLRAVGIEARKLAIRDILLALRLDGGNVETDLALSASIRAEIAANGTVQAAQGQIHADPGHIIDHDGGKVVTVPIDRADARFNWDAQNHVLLLPFQVQSGGNQVTLRAAFERQAGRDGVWIANVTRDDPVIDPVILAGGGTPDPEGLALNRANLRARIDLANRRFDLEQADFRRIDTRPAHNIGIALSGSLDWSGADPRLAFGVAGTRMPMSTMLRLWPFFIVPDVRAWVEQHMSGGMVERVVIAGNALLPQFKPDGPPMPVDGLSVDIETSGTTLRPIDDLPAIRDADLTVHVTGGNATVNLGRGTVEVAPERKLAITGGAFEVPDTHLKPRAPANATFRLDGTLPAAATLLASKALSDSVGIALDPATTRGTVSAKVALDFMVGKDVPANSASYTVSADLANFAADKLLFGQKVEASALRVTASNDGYQIKGDVKVNATPAAIELTKKKGEGDADLRVSALLDEAARRRFGIDLGAAVTGAIPVKLTGRYGGADDRVNVDADLTPVKIDNLLPGWVKAAGAPARATYTLGKTAKAVRFDDLTIEGSGTLVKGAIELDSAGGLVSANFPVFGLSGGDKASLKADRSNDGVLKVVMRGDVYDGQKFVKSAMAGTPDKAKQKQGDLDLDIKLGTVLGHNGETLRGLDLKLSRRSGHVRSFTMNARIGRDSPLVGDLRLRARDNHQVVYFETEDAGALFRFTDMYPRMFGGQMWVAMDPPSQDQAPQIGTLYIRNFAVRGEPALERVVAGAPGGESRGSVDFSEMRADFTRFTGKMAIRDGVVRGPLVGVTVEGQIDYVRDDVHLRGTFVPFYGLNNMFGQIPIVGLFLGGGSNEGLLGITYEAVGPPNSPRITVNPVTAITPGLLRKFIPSPGSFDSKFIPPTR
ncbi:MAG TPA: hypothetical protein VG986_14150 [Pseudolabrys sp.]|nr:hypothetical protein [Pseudolabrys sp.]